MTIWHNNRCSKSREAKKILEESNNEFKVFDYLNQEITKSKLLAVKKQLGLTNIKDMLRKKELEYKTYDIENIPNEDEVIKIVLQNPKLIERPIIIKGDDAVIARPIENLIKLIG